MPETSVDGFDLAGKRALVVGSDGGVSRAIAEALSEAAAKVYGAVPHRSAEPGGQIDVDAAVKEALDHLGAIDVLISCLGQPHAAPFVELSDHQLDAVVEGNLLAPTRLVRSVARQMLARGGGRIVQVVSLVGERGVPNTAAYAACQAGLIQLVRVLALEWARENVRVNAIGLGWMEDDPLIGDDSTRLTRYLPTRRLGRADEVGALAVYLASDAADMMTGQVLWADGAVLSHA
jgi:NAD(P)-dependent dehydrogenase (short-subunit alcohol dehydrogenase family)